MKISEDNEKNIVAKCVCLLISLIGIIMLFICLNNNNIPMIITSIAYTVIMFLTFLHITFKKTLKLFYITAILLAFALEISYLRNGGTEGFGIIWMILAPILSLYLLSTRSFIILNSTIFIMLALGFWTPLNKYCYDFNTSFEVRFPIVILFEVLFCVFIKIWIRRTEKSRNIYFKELTDLQENLQQQIEERTGELEKERLNREKLMIELTKALAATIDAKDKYTSGHSLRVAQYSKEIARRMGLSEKQQQDIYLIGLLHDIGKIAIPDEIINKTSALTDEEFNKIKMHPTIGSEILSTIESMPEMKEGARWHHERWDGTGYPDNLKGDEIPTKAQIISVADSYDAMTSTRSYRSILSQNKVKEEIINGIGSQFSPEPANIIIQIIEEDKDYKLHE